MLSFSSIIKNNLPIGPANIKKRNVNEILNNYSNETDSCSIIDKILNFEINYNIIEKNVYRDLEIFEGLENKDDSIFNIIDKSTTLIGKLYLRNIINNPTDNLEILKKRQNILHKIDDNLYKSIKNKLDTIKELEKDIIWILRNKTSEENKLIDSVYFNNQFLQILNHNDDILTIYSLFKILFAPIYGVISPLVFFLLPYLYIQFFTSVKFDFNLYVKIFKMSIFGGFNLFTSGNSPKANLSKYFSIGISIIIYVQNLMNTIDISKNTHKIINSLHTKLNKLNNFTTICHELFKETQDIFKRNKVEIFSNEIQDETFQTEPSLLSNKGKILRVYRNISNVNSETTENSENSENSDNSDNSETKTNEINNDINNNLNNTRYKEYFEYLGEIDMYMSILGLVKEYKNNNHKICYSKYLEQRSPCINVKNIWHPSLIDHKIVHNNINVGMDNPNNLILTGPNAGGKSTFIKSISISLLLSQTFGIALASKFEFTPFTLINTYLNIPDCKGKESLFEAEMHRAKNHIDKLDKLDKLGEDKFSFIVMDEIFSSTNPEEGISGAYAIAERLSENKNSISFITTHFNYLTKLEKTNKFKNYNVPITKDTDGNIKYSYKLKEGTSNQFIALDLLKKKGFDNELVAKAQKICDTLITENKTNSENENSGSDNENSGSDNENSDNENSGSDNENSGNENENSGSDNENSGSENSEKGNSDNEK